MTTVTLPYNFDVRTYQRKFFASMNNGCKRAMLIWHRRAGKDICVWNYLIYTAVKKKGIYYYIFPTFAQGRKVLWDGMTSDGRKFMDYIPKGLIKQAYQQEMKIRLINGSLIQIVGSDNYDALMGTNPTGCIFSEYSLQDPNAWQYIRPILDVNGGWAIFVFTPRGTNHAKELFDSAVKPDNEANWFVQKLTVNDTDVLKKEDIDRIRLDGMSEDMIQQEFYCSFTLGIQGSYYARLLDEAKESGRVGNVPYDKYRPVKTSWDIGVGDATSIVFFQTVGNEIHFIDFYENSSQGLPHYIKIVNDKPYSYAGHFVPQDIMARELSSGASRLEIARELGIEMRVLKTNDWSIEAGIETVRGLFPRFWIDEKKCNHIIRALENYRAEYDEKREVYKPRPVHDKWSHCADAIRYASIAIKTDVDGKAGPNDAWVDGMQDRYNPRFS